MLDFSRTLADNFTFTAQTLIQLSMKILILRFSSIGDIVLTTPVIRTLKTQLDAEIHYATKKQFQNLLVANPYLDKIHLLDGKLNDLYKELKKEQFDVVIDLHNNLRTKILKLRLMKRSYTFHKLNIQKWLFVNFKLDLMPKVHIVDRYMMTVKKLGVKMDSLGLDYFIPHKDEVEHNWLPETHQNGYVAVVLGAKFKTKQLPDKRLVELCARVNKPIVLIGGKEEIELGKKIEQFFNLPEGVKSSFSEELDKRTIIFNGCGKFSLNQSASLIQHAEWVCSHDTGMMHIAAAFKKRIISIWGNTVPAFGMYPYRTDFVIFENKISCRPCSKIGFNKCPKGHFNCMNGIKFDFYGYE